MVNSNSLNNSIKNYIEYISGIVLLLTVFFQVFPYQIGIFSSTHYLPLFAFIYLVLIQLLGLEDFLYNKSLVWIYFLFSLWILYGVISTIWSYNTELTFNTVRYRFFYFCNFYFITQFLCIKRRFNLFKIILYVSVIFSIIFVINETISFKHLSTSSSFNKLTFLPSGAFFNPNDLSAVLLILSPFFCFEKNQILKYLANIILISFLAIFLITGARLALLIFVPFYGLYFIFKVPKPMKIIFLLVILLIPYYISTLKPFIRHEINRYVDHNILSFGTEKSSQRTSSVLIRSNLALIFFDRFIESKGLGVGAGNAELNISQQEIITTNNIPNPHNFFVETLVNDGVVGFVCLSIIVCYILYLVLQTWKINIRDTHYMSIIFVFFFLFSVSIPSSIKIIFVYWIALAFVVANLLFNSYNQNQVTKDDLQRINLLLP